MVLYYVNLCFTIGVTFVLHLLISVTFDFVLHSSSNSKSWFLIFRPVLGVSVSVCVCLILWHRQESDGKKKKAECDCV